MAPSSRPYIRPASAIPQLCVMCGGSGDLAWHPYRFEYGTPLSMLALSVGVVHARMWEGKLPACGRCRARERRGGLLLGACSTAGILASLVILYVPTEIGLSALPAFVLMLTPTVAGLYLGNRLRGPTRPRLVRAAGMELTIAIPGHGLLRLVNTDPAKVDAAPEPAMG